MMGSVDMVRSIAHPLVKSAYTKKDFNNSDRQHDSSILVIETNFNSNDKHETGDFDSYLVDLLVDLQDLKEQAEKEVGTVSRVDIRHH
jgi:hypothetical protein